jgi:hypothetical protein
MLSATVDLTEVLSQCTVLLGRNDSSLKQSRCSRKMSNGVAINANNLNLQKDHSWGAILGPIRPNLMAMESLSAAADFAMSAVCLYKLVTQLIPSGLSKRLA